MVDLELIGHLAPVRLECTSHLSVYAAKPHLPGEGQMSVYLSGLPWFRRYSLLTALFCCRDMLYFPVYRLGSNKVFLAILL